MLADRHTKTVKMIVRKVQDNNYMDGKRYILTIWRDYVKREVKLIRCIEKVCVKSLWAYGLAKIRDEAKDRIRQDTIESVLERFR